MHFDERVLREHHRTIGCSPPYHQSDKPLCTTKTNLAASVYEINEIGNRYFPTPCEGMSNIVFSADEVPLNISDNLPRIYFTYPEKVKIIQQIKSVDIHSLIGNIGGYIGLFLGKKLDLDIEVPYLVIKVFNIYPDIIIYILILLKRLCHCPITRNIDVSVSVSKGLLHQYNRNPCFH